MLVVISSAVSFVVHSFPAFLCPAISSAMLKHCVLWFLKYGVSILETISTVPTNFELPKLRIKHFHEDFLKTFGDRVEQVS